MPLQASNSSKVGGNACACVLPNTRPAKAKSHIARKCFEVVACSLCGDFFGCESLETLKLALQCFAHLVRLLLGASALAGQKLAAGSTLEALGIEMHVSWENYFRRPSSSKKQKWLWLIRKALVSGILSGCEASKLAGKLQWAGQHMFNRVGRAMSRALYKQIRNTPGRCRPDLVVALRWWGAFLGWVLWNVIVCLCRAKVQCADFVMPREGPLGLLRYYGGTAGFFTRATRKAG